MLLKATWVWLLIVAAAILNGFLREKVLVSTMGTEAALPTSGVLLATLVFLVALMSIPFIRPADTKSCIRIGLYWLVLTLSFEFLFGYFIVQIWAKNNILILSGIIPRPSGRNLMI